MRTIELNGVTLTLTEETAEAIERELNRERECWIEHGPYCREYKKARARNWR